MIEVNFYEEVPDEFLTFAVIISKTDGEIERILITDDLVDNWTYPLIQPRLLEEARRRLWS